MHIGTGEIDGLRCHTDRDALTVLGRCHPQVIEAVSYTHLSFMLFGMIANFFMTPLAMLGGLSIPFAQIAVSLGINPVEIGRAHV